MNFEKLGIWVFTAFYSCFVIFKPQTPHLYTLIVDVVCSILSFSSCAIIQVFLLKSTQQTIITGLCILFLVLQELGTIQIFTTSVLTNVFHDQLTTFFLEFPEVAKYVLNRLPIGSALSTSMFTLSLARLLLIASPARFQNINRKTCLRCSVGFIIMVAFSELLINHVRCMLTYSKFYQTISVLLVRIELGIAWQPSSTPLSTLNNQKDVLQCFEVNYPVVFLSLSCLLEIAKLGIFLKRLMKKMKNTAPLSARAANHLPPLNTQGKKDIKPSQSLKRSCSTGDLKVLVAQVKMKRRNTLKASDLHVMKGSVRNQEIAPLKAPVTVLQKTLIKQMKDFILRTSTFTLVANFLIVTIIINLLLKFDIRNMNESPINLISVATLMFVLVLPVILVLFDEQVLSYVKQIYNLFT